jgi:hypothetical protein
MECTLYQPLSLFLPCVEFHIALLAPVSPFALPVRDEPLTLGERDWFSVRCK